jgi:hypothetical protein
MAVWRSLMLLGSNEFLLTSFEKMAGEFDGIRWLEICKRI